MTGSWHTCRLAYLHLTHSHAALWYTAAFPSDGKNLVGVFRVVEFSFWTFSSDLNSTWNVHCRARVAPVNALLLLLDYNKKELWIIHKKIDSGALLACFMMNLSTILQIIMTFMFWRIAWVIFVGFFLFGIWRSMCNEVKGKLVVWEVVIILHGTWGPCLCCKYAILKVCTLTTE